LQIAVAVPQDAAIGDDTVQIFEPDGGVGIGLGVGVGVGVGAGTGAGAATRCSTKSTLVFPFSVPAFSCVM
jgi:hypothetical protein